MTRTNKHTFLCGSLGGSQDGWGWGSDGRGLGGDSKTEVVVHLLYGIAARRDKRGLARVVALQDEHAAQVIVETRARALNEPAEPLRKLYLLLRELLRLRKALVDLLRDLLVLGAERRGTAAQRMPDVPGCLFIDLLLEFWCSHM